MNIRLYRNTLPKGVDLFFDLKRYGLLQHVSLVFDVGANVGDFSLNCRRHAPNARVLAFEPVPSTYTSLQNHTGGDKNIETFCIGFGEAPAEVEVRVQKDSVMNSLKAEIASSVGEIERLRIDQLDRFCEERRIQNIGLLKTDTEGYDMEVLRGAKQLLAEQRVYLVCCEVGFQAADTHHTPFASVWPYLQANGFDLIGFYHQGSFWKNNGLDAADAVFINPKAR